MRKARMKKVIFFIVFIFSTQSVFAFSASSVQARILAASTNNLKPNLVNLAIKTFNRAKKHGIIIKKPIITVIDYSLPSTTNRLWVLDLEKNQVLYTSLVAHGKHSGENLTTSFSNRVNSHQTSLGLFLTDTTYFGREGYSLRMKGLEKGFNDNAETRAIVMHGAAYVTKYYANSGRIGRSWGCPAVEPQLAKHIINTVKNRTLVLAYYPDKTWLNNSRFIN
jgi:hypothetical protein